MFRIWAQNLADVSDPFLSDVGYAAPFMTATRAANGSEPLTGKLAVPRAPIAKRRHRGLPALQLEAGAQALRVVALEDAAGVLVQEVSPCQAVKATARSLTAGW